MKSLQGMGMWPIEEETPISAEFVIYYCQFPALLLVCSSAAAETVNERKWWIWKGLFAAGVTILVTECFQWTKYSPIMLSESEAAINPIQQEQLSHWGCQHGSFQHPVSLKVSKNCWLFGIEIAVNGQCNQDQITRISCWLCQTNKHPSRFILVALNVDGTFIDSVSSNGR